MRKYVSIVLMLICVPSLLLLLASCGSSDGVYGHDEISTDLIYESSLELEYAEQFTADFYEDGCALITVADTEQYLYVPEDADMPSGVPEEVMIIQGPARNIYVAGTADMDYYVAMDGLDDVGFTSLEADGWYLDEVAAAVSAGDILYAGKYSAPDYELLLGEGCDLIIENTMIMHSPDILEQLRELGFPTLVDHSSYEDTVCGRMEWIKLYGILSGRLDEAVRAYDAQAETAMMDYGDTGCSVAFFYFTSSGTVNVRNSDDYVAQMIAMAGGTYALSDLSSEDATGTTTIGIEDFISSVSDVDYLIYNSTIQGEVDGVDDLIARCPLLADCRAVREGHVYCTGSSMYQSVMELGTVVSDIHKMMNGGEDMTFIYHLD